MNEYAALSDRDFAVNFGKVVISELRRRAQLRILGIQAQISAYRWRKHALPMRLEDVIPASNQFDPLSGESFVYERHPDGTYRLYSKGRPETGQVELHYAFRPGSAEADPSP